MVEEGEGWRLVSCIWLHAGAIHLLANMLSLLFIGIRLEQEFGFCKCLQVLAGKSQLVLNPLFQITASLFILKSVWKICWPKPFYYFGGRALRNFRGVVGIVGSMWDDIFDCTRLLVPAALWRVPNRFVKSL